MPLMRTIEIDAATADELEARAATRGVSVGQMVAELVALEAPLPADAEDIAELDRQWAEIEAGAPTVPREKVARWLETWGTPAFRSWHSQ
jgi:predicted transcriptional regulator